MVTFIIGFAVGFVAGVGILLVGVALAGCEHRKDWYED